MEKRMSMQQSDIVGFQAKTKAEAEAAWKEAQASTSNTSGLSPLGRAVQVSPFEPARERSMIELPKSVLDKERTVDMIVKVVEVGPACWPDEPARCKVGDIVFVAKMAGFMATGPLDGKPYRFVNDRDIFIKVTGGEVQS
jgi:co-chaperonin GroES (HSP10)